MTPTTQLALDGGQPSLASGHPASWPSTSHHGLDALNAFPPPDAREWNHPMVAKLERRWRNSTGLAHVVACRSGRVALHLAIAGLELCPGDEVICPADAVELSLYLERSDLVPVPVDLDPRTLHLDAAAVEAAITPRTQAIVVVDQHGTTADYNALAAVAGRHGLILIEDASQSIGASYDQRPVGSLGDVSICALIGDDARSTLGTGGLFATDDGAAATAVRRQLLVNDDSAPALAADDHAGTGWSYQLSDLDAAMADAQLAGRLDRLATRCRNGSHLRARLAEIPGVWTPEIVRSATHVYTSLPLVIMPDELGLPEATASTLRDTAIDCLTAEGLWIDRWLTQPLGESYGVTPTVRPGQGAFPVAEGLLSTGLVLGRLRSPFDAPQHTGSMDRIADCFQKVFITNADRLRLLTEQRFKTLVMT